jgi:membrane protease subunit HflK
MTWNDPNRFRGSRLFRGASLPTVEQILRIGRTWFRGFLNQGPSGRSAFAAALAALVVWLLSGAFIVQPDEQGVVLRFGALARTTPPGIHYHLPWPIETALTPSVTRENQINIGYRLAASGVAASVPEESLSLTGDENIVEINFTVYWLIDDAPAFLFNLQNPALQPDATVKMVAESAMREIVGKSQIEPILTANREAIQQDVRQLMQTILTSYGAGVMVTRVQMQKADPPAQVLNAYRDVQAARTDQDRMRNEALAYANKAVPEARGGAARIVQQAEGYKQQAIALSQGEAQRFIAIHDQYKQAPNVTRRRIYIDTMQSIFAGLDKVIVDSKGGPGVVPYLPLPQLRPGPAVRAVPPVADTAPAVRAAPPVADNGKGR